MTVDDFEMNMRARGLRAGLDNASEERWKELADLTDGRREIWMTDRAKHALGTPKLASIFLQEEKGRIYRLRKIKSVLASGKYIGNVGGTTPSSSITQPERRGKRRPRQNPSHYKCNLVYHTNYRRFQQTDVTPNYPINPFGNVDSNTLQFAVPMGTRSSREETARNGRNEVNMQTQRNNVIDRSGSASTDDSRAIEEVVSALGASKNFVQICEVPTSRRDESGPLYSHYRGSSGGNGEKGQPLQNSASRRESTAMIEGNQGISSGPSAIDLFDQCGLVPVAAEEKEGLVGTTRVFQSSQESENYGSTGEQPLAISTINSTPSAPLVLGDPSSTSDRRGAGNHGTDAGRVFSKRTQASTHGVRPRPPFAGGRTSTRSKLARQQASSSSSGMDMVAGAPKPSRNLRRGAPSEAATAGPTSRCSRTVARSNAGIPPAATSTLTDKTDSRVRRRWNVDGASPTIAASSRPPAPPGGAAGGAGTDDLEYESPSASAPASASASGLFPASERRIAGAKERLHKNKNLEALKSEHVEALSILQDISCPSSAAVAVGPGHGATADNDGGRVTEDFYVEEVRKALLHEGKNSSSTSTSASKGRAAAQKGEPADAEVDQLSADLPRIGSQEQAALRAMYRKWWMKVARGGSLPSSSTPDGLRAKKRSNTPGGYTPSLPDMSQIDERGLAPPAGQQAVTVQGGAMTGSTDVGQEETVDTRAASEVPSMEGANGAEKTGSVEITESKKLSESENADVMESHTGGGVEAAGLEKSGDISKAPNVSKGDRDGDDVAIKHWRESTAFSGVELGKTDAPTACAPTAKRQSKRPPPAEEPDAAGRIPRHIGAEGSPPWDEAGGTSQSPAILQQQQELASDVESVSEEDDLQKEQEEGHKGRIYLPDGRFVSTRRNSADGETMDAVENLTKIRKADLGDGKGDEVVVDNSVAKLRGEHSVGYADEDFEIED